MQIVIELSDKTYKDIKEENSIYGINNGLSARITGKVVGAIQNGTLLPKGHGRLKDVDAFITKAKADRKHSAYMESWTADDLIDRLDSNYVPTIIPTGG